MTASQSAQGQPDEAAFWKDKFARLFADLDNTKKRLARTSAQEVEAQKETLLRELLPVADGLDLALLHTSEKHDNRDIMQGIELVREILNKFFAKYDVKAIDAWGNPFDPRLHEAIGVLPHPKFPPNTVVKVEQKGYLHGDKLLRPAQVVVTPS
jgi:molecular chaperone GrpE